MAYRYFEVELDVVTCAKRVNVPEHIPRDLWCQYAIAYFQYELNYKVGAIKCL